MKTQKNETSFVGQRAKALALIHLTRRDDVVISNLELDLGVDLVVHLIRKDSRARRTFGVVVKGTSDWIATDEQATKKLNSLKNPPKAGDIGMPVCVFFFSVQSNDGYYDWKVEPVLDEGRAKLVPRTTFHCKKLNAGAMDEIIGAVDKWHEALFRSFVN